jgi:4-amino-4-deoxy-L-arabinose transferase-like glycosyltransferase
MLAFLERYERKILWGIMLSSLLFSLAYSFHFRIEPIVDARAYDSIAWDIAEGRGYDTDSAIGRPGPGYEYFLAGIYVIFGRSYAIVWIIQALLLAATAGLTYTLAKFFVRGGGGALVRLLAALFVGWSPDLVSISAMLMTETFFLFLLALTLCVFFRYVGGGKLRWLVLGALLLALTVLTRSNALFLFAPIAGWLLYGKKWKHTAFFVLVFLIAMTPWTVRNYVVQGAAMPFNASLGLLYVGNHEGATGELIVGYPRPVGYGDFDAMGQVEADRALKRAGVDYILEHPLEFLKLTIFRLSIYVSLARPFAFWPHLVGSTKLIAAALSSLYAGILFIFGGVGIAAAFRAKDDSVVRAHRLLLLALAIMMPLSIAALVVETRYRFGVYPFLAVFAGLGLAALSEAKSWRERFYRVAPVLLLVFLNTIFDVVRNLGRILERL